MNVSLYQAASTLNAMERWQETIAENLASTMVPGYKKQDISFTAVESGIYPLDPAMATVEINPILMSEGHLSTNFSPGEMRVTGVKTDVAVDGNGFFEVELPDGASAFTRDGEFHIDAQGQMVTKEGYAVLGQGGPILLDLNNYSQLSISATGEVSQGTDLKGRLSLTEFANPDLLTRLSGGYFMAENPDAGSTDAAASTVRQGVLESANTSVVLEMANLIVAMRTFEANQKIVQLHDDRVGQAIADLGNVT